MNLNHEAGWRIIYSRDIYRVQVAYGILTASSPFTVYILYSHRLFFFFALGQEVLKW